MATNAFAQFSEFLKKPFVRVFAYLLGGLCLLILLVRSCSGSSDEGDRSYYRIARDRSWYPLELLNKEQNMVGFTNDLFDAISVEEKKRLEIVDVSSKSLFFGLDKGNWEAVLSSLQPDSYNRLRYNFSEPFYVSGLVLVVRMNSTMDKFADIEGKIVGIPKELALSPKIAQWQTVFTPYSKMSRAIEDMLGNRLDAVIMDYATANLFSQSIFSGKIKVATAPLVEDALRVVARNSPEGKRVIEIFNNGLNKLQKESNLEKLLLKWSLISQ